MRKSTDQEHFTHSDYFFKNVAIDLFAAMFVAYN